jgi:hypothetical protein
VRRRRVGVLAPEQTGSRVVEKIEVAGVIGHPDIEQQPDDQNEREGEEKKKQSGGCRGRFRTGGFGGHPIDGGLVWWQSVTPFGLKVLGRQRAEPMSDYEKGA